MSSILGRMIGAVYSWKSGPLALYRLLLPSLQPLIGETLGPTATEVRLSLVEAPGYFPKLVQESYDSLKFLHGDKIPLKVKVVTREASRSLQYGLVRTDHSVRIRGEKRYADGLLARIREQVQVDQVSLGLNTPRVHAQMPEGWLESGAGSSGAMSQNQGGDSAVSLKSIGLVGALIGIVAALAFFSSDRKTGQDSLAAAVSHLRKRGIDQLQLSRSERVEGGEKFYFQGAAESYTVVVDRDGRVYSWSRGPSGDGAVGPR